MIKKLYIFLELLLLFFLFVPPAHADTKINSSVAMQYSIAPSGNTHVTAHITLTNTTTNFYVSSYSLILGFPNVGNITASDPKGQITPVISQGSSGEQVTIHFNDIVTGLNNSLPFTIAFDTPDIANQNGDIWEVNIPGLQNQNDFSTFGVDVLVPPSFGIPTFIKPATGNSSLHFTKEQLGTSGISITFGKSQVYAYSLSYHLQNTNVIPVQTEIALPPTTNYQSVELDSLSPKPQNVTLDTDGNWLAKYLLSPSERLTVTANGLINVSLHPQPVVLSGKERSMYLEQQSYWQTNNASIMTLAKSLQTPEAIYNYVVNHVTYDFSRITGNQVRLGAVGVLQKPSSAVCLEFTDLFVTLARAAGIPAREVDGFAYTQNQISRPLSLSKDVLHAWPEYYDDQQGTWVMVDPTWGNTTGGVDYFHVLDFDHVAFAIQGVSSSYPVPAGGYKFDNQPDTKDVSVNVSPQQITAQPTVRLDAQMASTYLSGLPIRGQVVLQNTGSVLFPQEPIHITTLHILPTDQYSTSPSIPPFGTVRKSFGFAKTPFLTNTTDTITIALGGETLRTHIAIAALTPEYALIGGIGLVILIAIIWLITAKPWRL